MEAKQLYPALFAELAGQRGGELSGVDAVGFFRRSGLSDEILRDIWDTSDKRQAGTLNAQEFTEALKLIALAQQDEEPLEENLAKATDLASIDGLDWNTYRVEQWDVTAEEKAKFDNVFNRLELDDDGILGGDIARDVLLHSGLSPSVLGGIWECADIDKDGRLDRDEFAVAMHLVYQCLDGKPIPPSIPDTLMPPSRRPGAKDASSTGSTPPSTQRDVPMDGSFRRHAGMSKANTTKWVVSPKGRKTYSQFFKAADKDKDGYVRGDDVRSIFITSKLPTSELAHLWDLVDVFETGKLNSELFFLAMYLVTERVKGGTLPAKLSDSMIPPSCRDETLTEPPVCPLPTDVGASKKKKKTKSVKSSSKSNGKAAPTETSADTTSTTAKSAKKGHASEEPTKEQPAEALPVSPATSKPQHDNEDASKSSTQAISNSNTGSDAKSTAASSSTTQDTAAIDAELLSVTQSLKAQQITNDQLRAEADTVSATVSAKKNELEDAKRQLAALREEEKSLRDTLRDGKAAIRSLIEELKDADAAVQKVGSTNDRLRHSNNRVANAIHQFGSAPQALKNSSRPFASSPNHKQQQQQQKQKQRTSSARRPRGSHQYQSQRSSNQPSGVSPSSSTTIDPFAVQPTTTRQASKPFSVKGFDPWSS